MSQPPAESRKGLMKLTPQQFVVLRLLNDQGSLWGRDIRRGLKAQSFYATNQSFYELMDRLQGAGLVTKEVKARPLAGGATSDELHYSITHEGELILNKAFEFYDRNRKIVIPAGT